MFVDVFHRDINLALFHDFIWAQHGHYFWIFDTDINWSPWLLSLIHVVVLRAFAMMSESFINFFVNEPN